MCMNIIKLDCVHLWCIGIIYNGPGIIINGFDKNALKCREPSPALMQMSTCAYLISMCGIRRACHFSQNG